MTGIQAFHLALDLLCSGACGFAVVQWRTWQREAEHWRKLATEAEAAAAASLTIARHFHEKMQRVITEAHGSPLHAALLGQQREKGGEIQ